VQLGTRSKLKILFKKTFGGVTGDTFGATNEINEVLILIVMVALVGKV